MDKRKWLNNISARTVQAVLIKATEATQMTDMVKL